MSEKERRNKIDEVIRQGRYKDSWESLQQYRVPKWFENAKFGIFIHWGVYSVPAFANEWYPRNMYIKGSPEFQHHIETYGKHTEFGYKDFIPMFRAEKFEPAEWAELFERAGARYVVPVAEHHDGFQMYKSALSDWNASKMGPKRDVLREILDQAEIHGMIRGASSHRLEHWYFMGHGREFDSDIKDPKKGDLYWPSVCGNDDFHDIYSKPVPTEEYLEDWLLRTCEIIDDYRPKLLYFDWWIQHSSANPYLKKIAAYYYNRAEEWKEEVVICYKHDAFMFGTAVLDIERGQFAQIQPYKWQTDTAVARNAWCYTDANDYKSSSEILQDLVDIVSKNGNLLLNIGPRADGTIPDQDRQILLDIGSWLKVNGEAIYGSKVWRTYGEGPTQIEEGQFSDGEEKRFTSEDIRYTVNGDSLYAIPMKSSENGRYCFKALGERDATRRAEFSGMVKEVDILGFETEVSWKRSEEALEVSAPGIASENPIVFRIRLQ